MIKKIISISNFSQNEKSAQLINTKRVIKSFASIIDTKSYFLFSLFDSRNNFLNKLDKILGIIINVSRSFFLSIFSNEVLFYSRNFYNIFIPSILNKRVIYEIHSLNGQSKLRKLLIELLSYSKNFKIILVSKKLFDDLGFYEKSKKNSYIFHNGYDYPLEKKYFDSLLKNLLNKIQDFKHNNPNKKLIIHFGGIRKFDIKNLKTFLDSLKDKFIFCFIGLSDEEMSMLDGNLLKIGYTSNIFLEEIIEISDHMLFYLDHHSENQTYCPLKLIEYLFYKSNIIASDCEIVNELLDGFNYDHLSINGIKLINIKNLNISRVEERFSLSNRAKNILKLYK